MAMMFCMAAGFGVVCSRPAICAFHDRRLRRRCTLPYDQFFQLLHLSYQPFDYPGTRPARPRAAIGGCAIFLRPTVRTAIAAYIIIATAIACFALRRLTNLGGWDFVADLLLHYFMPRLFVIDWLFLASEETLKPKDGLAGPAFPVDYLV